MPTLPINPEIVCIIIDKATQFQVKEGVTFPDENNVYSDEYDWAQVLATHKNDLTYLEVKDAINKLEPDQQIVLIALMYLGRGDFGVDEWKDALTTARDLHKADPAEYLLSHPFIANHLKEGLAILGYSCEEK